MTRCRFLSRGLEGKRLELSGVGREGGEKIGGQRIMNIFNVHPCIFLLNLEKCSVLTPHNPRIRVLQSHHS